MSRIILRKIAASLVALSMLVSLTPNIALAEEPVSSVAAATVSEPEVLPDAQPTPVPEATPDAEATPVPEATPDAEATPVPEATPDTQATPVPEATPDTQATPVPEATPDAEATPVPEATPDTTLKTPPLRVSAAPALLSDSGYNFGMTDDNGYILVEKNWKIDLINDLPFDQAEITPLPDVVTIPLSSALVISNSWANRNTTRTTVTVSNEWNAVGNTFSVTAQFYQTTEEDGSLVYHYRNDKPQDGTAYSVVQCKWNFVISDHIYEGNIVETQAPTCTQTGTATADCVLCRNSTTTISVPALHSTLGSGEACPSCGQVAWTWDESTKTLTIGADVPSYTQDIYSETRPYQQYAAQVEHVIIGENVKQLGSFAFANFTSLVSAGPVGTQDGYAVLNADIVGIQAFWNVRNIKNYTFNGNLQSISACLYNCGEIDSVTLNSFPSGSNPGKLISGTNYKTVVNQLTVNAPDATIGTTGTYTIDNVIHLTLNVGSVLGGINAADLESLTVQNASSISNSFLDARYHSAPNLQEITLENVSTVGEYAFSYSSVQKATLENVGTVGTYAFWGANIQEAHLKDVGALQDGVFYDCEALSKVTIENVGLIGAYCFDNCSALTTLDVPEETKLGYSNIFDFSDPSSPFYYLKDRMVGILDGRFALEENPTPAELTVPAGWESSRLGKDNEAALDKTQVTKSARWADKARTVADVEFQFNYAKTQGMDFLFIIDYSGSMSKIGNYTDNTLPDETVDDNSRFFDMQSKLLDVSEQLLNTEGYDNRVAFVTFSTDGSYLHTQDFTGDYAAAEDFVLGYQPYGSTNYSLPLSKAYEMINGRTDTSREAAVIFISDGQPNRFLDGTQNQPADYPGPSRWNSLVAQINDYADKIKNIQQFGHDTKIFGVLQSVPSSDEVRCQQVLEGVATDGLFFQSSDTESFSTAINNAIGATYNVYTLTDTIDPAFTLDESTIRCSAGTWTLGTDANGNQQITWTITGVPYLTHTLDYQLKLNPNADGSYPTGAFDTNEGDAPLALGGTAVNAVATPTLARGSLLLQPADITIYMGGDEGYEGVVSETGVITDTGSNSLPQPGFYVTLPAELDTLMKQAWANSGDISSVENADGTTTYVMNLSDYLRLEDPADGKSWTLSLYSSGYSLAYAKYIYRIEPTQEGMDPIRLQFVDENGTCHTSDTFVLADALYQDYTMQVYNKAVQSGDVVAKLRIDQDSWVSLPLTLAQGNLTIRYVTGSQADAVTPAVSDVADAAPAKDTPLEHASVVVSDQTRFYINDSRIPADGADVSLLFDDVVTDETVGSTGDYAQLLGDTALTRLDTTLTEPRWEAKYLDLVDAGNGNVWLTPSEPVQVYWPYPAGTNANTRFYLIHFKDLDREMDQEDLTQLLENAETEILSVNTDAYGISFSTDEFSPFVLVWDKASVPAAGQNTSQSGGSAPAVTPAPTAAPAAVTQTDTIPRTEDPMPVTLWVMLLAGSAAGLAWTVQRKRRSGKQS